jgi:hypothetical protein
MAGLLSGESGCGMRLSGGRFESGADWLEIRSREAWGEFYGIAISIKLATKHSGLSTRTDQHHDPPIKSFKLGGTEFEFRDFGTGGVGVTFNSVSLGILSPGEKVTINADGTILINGIEHKRPITEKGGDE